MQFDWTTLGNKAPTALVKARSLAHHALQWTTKAALANPAAEPADGQSGLAWDDARGALFSPPLPAAGAEVRVGLRLAGLALIILRGNIVLDTYELAGRRDSMVAVWLDSALRALGLKAASDVTLPYTLASHPVARGSAYSFSGESEAFDELTGWFSAGADVLEEIRAGIPDAHAGAVLCGAQRFDLAMRIGFDAAGSENERSISMGLSVGDHYYPQPYLYVSAHPHLNAAGAPALPPPGRWHTQGFVGAVATAEELLALDERRTGALAFVQAAFDAARAQLGAPATAAIPVTSEPVTPEPVTPEI